MIDVDEYNAVAMKLLEALQEAESDFTWSYMNPQYKDLEKKEGLDLSIIKVRAMTKKRYAKGRLFMDQEISRVLLEDSEVNIVTLLIAAANTSAAEKLREENERVTDD